MKIILFFSTLLALNYCSVFNEVLITCTNSMRLLLTNSVKRVISEKIMN